MANSPTYVSCSLKKQKSSLLKRKIMTPNLSKNPSNFKNHNHLKTECRGKQTKIHERIESLLLKQQNMTMEELCSANRFYKAVTNNILN